VVFGGGDLPSSVDFFGADAPGKGQVQSLTRHDRIKIGMLTQRAPVGFAQRRAALFAPFAS
jgi:hypothetical protein